MKKLLLGLAVAFTAMTASAAEWAVVGSYTDPNWNFEASTKFTGTGDNLTCTISNLISDFKIIDISEGWSIQYGTATPIEIGQEYKLDAKTGEPDPSNIRFATPILSVKNATVSWNPSTATMKITAAESDIVKGYPTLYVTGSFNDWKTPGDDGSVTTTEKDGIYTAKFNLGTSGNVEFKLAGAGWSNEIAGGATVTNDAAVKVTNGGGNLKTTLTGEQTLTFNINTMLMTFGDPELVNSTEEPARTWALVGAYSDWKFENSVTFNGEGDNLTCTVNKLTNDFKIVDITNNSWDIQYGTSTPVEIGKEYVLTGKVDGKDAPNTSFATPVLSVSNATVSWNPSTATMKITAAATDIESGYPTLYVTGNMKGINWPAPGTDGSVLCEREGTVYTAIVDFGDQAETEFKLAGEGWSNEIAGGVEIGTTPVAVTNGGDNLKTTMQGELKLVFDIETMEMYLSTDTGVASIEATESEAVYFNLQGIRVENPTKGIYIVKQGSKTTKAVIR